MKLPAPLKVKDAAMLTGAEVIGDGGQLILGINEIHKVVPGDVTFVDHPKYYARALGSAATVVIINKKAEAPQGKALLFTHDPFTAYNKLVLHYRSFEPAKGMVSSSAQIGEGTALQPGVFVGNHVVIGRNCLIHPFVSIYDHCIIGDDVIIHSNAVIGSDAFYYQKKPAGYEKMHSCGRVIVGNRVEIGAGTTIDKGVSGDTIIGDGTRIDNLVQVGHGTVVGKDCLFAAQVGIAGKVTIGNNVILWGQVGVSKDLTIGDNVIVGAQSGVAGSLEGGKVYFGSPAREARGAMKEMLLMRRLPEMWEKLRATSARQAGKDR